MFYYGEIDVLLVCASSVVSILLSGYWSQDERSSLLRAVLVGGEGHDVVQLLVYSVGVIGVATLALVASRARRHSRLSFNTYVLLLSLALTFNFVVTIILISRPSKVMETLSQTLQQHLKEAHFLIARFGFTFSENDAWDYLQTQAKCCGVESYEDYLHFKNVDMTQPVPLSCCVLKSRLLGSVLKNEAQCQHDASRVVSQSSYLHTVGCLGFMKRWFSKYIEKLTALLFIAVLLEAGAVLYLSWKGYMSTTQEYKAPIRDRTV